MAYETKVILASLAQHAAIAKSEYMYNVIANMANTEGVVLKPYDEAIKEVPNTEKS